MKNATAIAVSTEMVLASAVGAGALVMSSGDAAPDAAEPAPVEADVIDLDAAGVAETSEPADAAPDTPDAEPAYSEDEEYEDGDESDEEEYEDDEDD